MFIARLNSLTGWQELHRSAQIEERLMKEGEDQRFDITLSPHMTDPLLVLKY
jgi:hypothetical protein